MDVECRGTRPDRESFRMDDLGNSPLANLRFAAIGQVTQRHGTHTYSVDSLTNRYTQIDAASDPVE